MRPEPWIDRLRVWGALAVIALHVSGPAFRGYPGRPTARWLAANLWNSGTRWAVPVYLLLSGYLLLGRGRNEAPVAFWRRRSVRIGAPLLFWGAAYAVWYGARTVPEVVRAVLVRADAGYHLWFLYALAVLSLGAPVLARMLEKLSPAAAITVCALAFAPFLRIPGVPPLVRAEDLPRWLELGLPFFGYFLLGALLCRQRAQGPMLLPLLLVLLALAAVVGGTAWSTIRQGAVGHRALQDPLSPGVVLLSASLCVLARRAGDGFPLRGLERWAPAVLGVYLVHPMVLEVLAMAGVSLERFPWWLEVPALTACVAALSLAVVLGMRRMPVLRRVV
ncbi:MAG TPA: acyltransferase family protein [Candidatus Polarisedimenticolaceae bacterium]|nr:acyltransferase family protein [Candidatus Polarisedimenticolaceae bacterium]